MSESDDVGVATDEQRTPLDIIADYLESFVEERGMVAWISDAASIILRLRREGYEITQRESGRLPGP